MSGAFHAHNTAAVLFQEVPTDIIRKPSKSSVDPSGVQCISKLPCQEIKQFHSAKRLPLLVSFTVEEELFHAKEVSDLNDENEFIISCVQNDPQDETINSPIWPGICSLISPSVVPNMHVGFLPFLPQLHENC